jgi:biopolymer transport protein ExbD
MFAQNKKRRAPRIEIIPMVDVMFLLLVFYILSSLALHKERGIAVNLPTAQSGEGATPSQNLVVSITPAGDYFLNKDKVSQSGLADALKAWSSNVPGGADKASVVLNADMATPHRFVVEAMDALRSLGVVNFTISTAAAGAPR